MPTTLLNVAAKSVVGPQNIPSAISTGEPNISETERWVSLVGGAVLAGCGLTCTSGTARVILPVLGGALAFRGLTGWCGLYSALGMNTACDSKQNATSVEAGNGVKVEETVTVNKPASELFAYWRNLSQLPRFMEHLKEVRVTDSNTSHWVAKAPLGLSVEWDAEIHNEKPNELIAWRSLPGSDIDTAGTVQFRPAPNGRGTEVKVTLKYDSPAGKLGRAIAKLFRESPDVQIRSDLKRFKSLLETGEVASIHGQPSGRR